MRTIAHLLYPDHPTGRKRLERKLRKHPAIKPLLVWPGVLSVVAGDIVAFLEIPVGNLAVTAYQRHRRIDEAKKRTARSPEAREVVQLMEHKITNKLEPKIEVEFNGVRKTVLTLELAAELTVESVTATVQFGQLVDLAPGSAKATLRLSAGDIELARAETKAIDLAVPDSSRVVVDLTSIGEPILDRVAIAR